MQPHRKGCRNESESFADVRLAFPTLSIHYLFDLFEKCRGDANWMMNILLNEDADADNIPGGDADEDFHCACDAADSEGRPATAAGWGVGEEDGASASSSGGPDRGATSKRAVRQGKKKAAAFNLEAEQMKRQLEASVCIGDQFYTENMNRVREWRNTKKRSSPAKPLARTGPGRGHSPSEDTERPLGTEGEQDDEQDDDDDDDGDDYAEEGEDVFEFRLGSGLINQLEGLFNANSDGLDFHKFRPNVFMKRSLAKQIYHLWVESMMYQLEEQKLDALKDDEEIARQINQLDELKRSAVNFSDVSQMASAMHAYRADNDWASGGTDLAVKLKRQKLYEIFPQIGRATVDELLQQHDDNYERVVEMLNQSGQHSDDAHARLVEQQNKLILAAKIETEKVSGMGRDGLKTCVCD